MATTPVPVLPRTARLPRRTVGHAAHLGAVSWRDLVRAGQSLSLAVLPAGGQGRARRNAWAATTADSLAARTRADVAASLAAGGGSRVAG